MNSMMYLSNFYAGKEWLANATLTKIIRILFWVGVGGVLNEENESLKHSSTLCGANFTWQEEG
jgi:hypothetical protein